MRSTLSQYTKPYTITPKKSGARKYIKAPNYIFIGPELMGKSKHKILKPKAIF